MPTLQQSARKPGGQPPPAGHPGTRRRRCQSSPARGQAPASHLPLAAVAAAGGPMERRRPGHAGFPQAGPVAGVHSVRPLDLPVRVPLCVRVAAVLDFDGGPGLPPEMLGGLEGGLPLSRHRKREGQALLGAGRWRFHLARRLRTGAAARTGHRNSASSGQGTEEEWTAAPHRVLCRDQLWPSRVRVRAGAAGQAPFRRCRPPPPCPARSEATSAACRRRRAQPAPGADGARASAPPPRGGTALPVGLRGGQEEEEEEGRIVEEEEDRHRGSHSAGGGRRLYEPPRPPPRRRDGRGALYWTPAVPRGASARLLVCRRDEAGRASPPAGSWVVRCPARETPKSAPTTRRNPLPFLAPGKTRWPAYPCMCPFHYRRLPIASLSRAKPSPSGSTACLLVAHLSFAYLSAVANGLEL